MLKNKGMIALATIVVLCTATFMVRPTILHDIFGKPQAQQQEKEVKLYEIHDDATFAENTFAYNTVPMGDNDLAMSINVPKNWESDTTADSVTQTLDNKILHNITRFRSPMIGVVRATLALQALKLEHEITAKSWLKNYIITNGYAPQGDIVSEDRHTAAVYFVWTNDGTASYTYMRVRINAGKIIVSRFDAPIHLKEFLSYLQKKAPDSMTVTYPKETPVETQKAFALVDSIKFSYPISWQILSSDFRDMNRLNVQLQNVGIRNKIDGYISFVGIRRTRSASLRAEIDNMRTYFNEAFKLDIVDLVSSETADVTTERFIFKRHEIYNVQNQDTKRLPQELHFVVLGDKDWYIFGFLITPQEKDNLYTWARNTETLNVILRSIR